MSYERSPEPRLLDHERSQSHCHPSCVSGSVVAALLRAGALFPAARVACLRVRFERFGLDVGHAHQKLVDLLEPEFVLDLRDRVGVGEVLDRTPRACAPATRLSRPRASRCLPSSPRSVLLRDRAQEQSRLELVFDDGPVDLGELLGNLQVVRRLGARSRLPAVRTLVRALLDRPPVHPPEAVLASGTREASNGIPLDDGGDDLFLEPAPRPRLGARLQTVPHADSQVEHRLERPAGLREVVIDRREAASARTSLTDSTK